jgi:drug/metabolite transporter (DMT)-like permease
LGSTRTGVYSNAIPIVALLIAWLTLGEVPTWLQGMGAVGIVAGAVLARLGRIEDVPERRSSRTAV